jgi:hypothetical protein
MAFPIFHLVNLGSSAILVITISLYLGLVQTLGSGLSR